MEAGGRRPCSVPAVGHEPDYWVAMNDSRAPRAAMAGASGPYESTVPALLADLVLELPADLAVNADDAAAELARFDEHLRAGLGGDGAASGPMSALLLRVEAAASSRIEHLTTGAREIALAELGQSTSEYAAAAVADVRGLETALRLADRLDEHAILAVHRALRGASPGGEHPAGRYRDQLVWVGGSRVTPRGAAYVGPKSDLVPRAMLDLVTFLRRADLPVVAHAAITYAQLETIRPFPDGNGRTARALVHAVLRARAVLSSTTAPISAGLLVGAGEGADALDAYRAGDARGVVERFCEAARFAARSAAELVDRLAEQIAEGHASLAASGRAPESATWLVLPQLVAQPMVNARYLQDRLTCSAPTAQRALAELAEAGVLTESTGLRRERVWQHDGILAVLDAYAASLRRG